MNLIKSYRSLVKQRIENKSITFLVVVGPCSVSCEKETLLFAQKLATLQQELGSSIFLVMRAFVEKSRTANSWKGFVYQPDLDKPENIIEGLRRTQKLFSSLSVPLSMEFIDPTLHPYLAPFITWGFIGARTATSMTHRVLASHDDIPFGFKHSLDGDVQTAINSIEVANHPHCVLTETGQTFTKGNKHTHVILRGGKVPNYEKSYVEKTIALSKAKHISTPVLIDCSHGNSHNKPDDQKTVFLDVLDQYLENPQDVMGLMMESNIFKGASKESKKFGYSYTDPCLDFEETRSLLLYAKNKITLKFRKEGLDQHTSCAYNH